jgi:hypothetical protein
VIPQQFPPLVGTLNVGLGLLVIVLGLAITWRAFQGSRRNDSRPLLFLAVGMLFITVLPSILELVVVPLVARYFVATAPAIELTLVTSRTSKVLGIAILLYSLHVRR